MSAVSKMSAAQKAEFKKCLAFIKNCPYKGTAVKVELEADLKRNIDEDNDCAGCDGSGLAFCSNPDCEDGVLTDEEGTRELCSDCDGQDREDCAACNGSGVSEDGGKTWSLRMCREFIKDNVPAASWTALIYSQFYDDGSVDSEFTFTLPIGKAQLALDFIEAFYKLSKAIGRGCNTAGAGMHIGILNSSTGTYPAGNRLDSPCARNFKDALTPLIPSLLFLASCDHNSRSLRFRPALINLDGKMGLVGVSNYGNMLEYRLFETCYSRPQAFIDYMIVIAKTLQFYKDTPTDTSLKIGQLGIKDGRGIERFYYTVKHLEALEKGLMVLKPDYKTVVQLRKERGFRLSQATFAATEQERQKQWRQEFEQVKQRRREERTRLYQRGLRIALANPEHISNPPQYAAQYVKEQGNPGLYGSLRDYLLKKHAEYLNSNINQRITV